MKRALLVSLLLVPAAALADDVFLRGGGRLRGVIVQQSSASVSIDMGPGRVTLPMARVTRIVSGTADLAIYRERAARLSPTDASGWLALARWAEDHDLLTQAREAYAHVLTLDPRNAVAHRGLGHVWTGDRWTTLEESYRARGYVLFEGSWVTPEERRAILVERAETAAAAHGRIEAEARAREAEARARTAEAEARRAELASQPGGGIPVDLGYPYGGVYGGPIFGGVYDPLAPYVALPPLPPPPLIINVTVPPPHRDRPPRRERPTHSRGGRAALGPTDSKRNP